MAEFAGGTAFAGQSLACSLCGRACFSMYELKDHQHGCGAMASQPHAWGSGLGANPPRVAMMMQAGWGTAPLKNQHLRGGERGELEQGAAKRLCSRESPRPDFVVHTLRAGSRASRYDGECDDGAPGGRAQRNNSIDRHETWKSSGLVALGVSPWDPNSAAGGAGGGQQGGCEDGDTEMCVEGGWELQGGAMGNAAYGYDTWGLCMGGV